MVNLQSAARIIRSGEDSSLKNFEVPTTREVDLFSDQDLFGVEKGRYIRKARGRVLSDMEELMRKSRWEDIIALYHPVEEKLPELVRCRSDIPVRQKLAFAMGQIGQFDDAISQLHVCVKAEPDNFLSRSSLAYTAYNSLYAAKGKKIFLAGRAKADRIALAHDNFKQAQKLRPDGVTNFYRQAMLFSQLENKPKPALDRFNLACANWESLSREDKETRHQEKKNYVKSLYRSASLILESGNGIMALERITKCLEQDEQTNHISLGFKYFALGKVNFSLDRYDEARNALLFALQSSTKGSPVDFVHELLARTWLALEKPEKALETIGAVPEKFRRPYYLWTQADVLCTLKKFDLAKAVLSRAIQRDSRSKHISLIRLTKIEYTLKHFNEAMGHAEAAGNFYTEKWGNPYYEGMFWQSLCAFKAGLIGKARTLADDLHAHCRFYPNLNRLQEMIGR